MPFRDFHVVYFMLYFISIYVVKHTKKQYMYVQVRNKYYIFAIDKTNEDVYVWFNI